MGLLDKLRAELIDIVEWIDDSEHTLVWRFPRYHNQIKNGARLIVRPGQVAVFVHQGKIADVFEPGSYTLTTSNLPILSTLQGWKYGLESAFKSEVYFVSTCQITDLKWGTPKAVMLEDPKFGPIRLRAFGSYAIRATEPRALLTELVGTDSVFEAEEITELMRSMITTAFADVVAGCGLDAMRLAASYEQLSEELRRKICERVDDEYGLDVPQLFIVNISFPEEVERALDARSSMGLIGDLGRFQQYRMGDAMTLAAANPAGGGASEGMGLGMGFALANQLAQGLAPAVAPAAAGAVPMPGAAIWHVARDGQSAGPFTAAQLAELAGRGQMLPATPVWCPGMASWQPAGGVPQLAYLFAAPPPPPPPPPPPAS